MFGNEIKIRLKSNFEIMSNYSHLPRSIHFSFYWPKIEWNQFQLWDRYNNNNQNRQGFNTATIYAIPHNIHLINTKQHIINIFGCLVIYCQSKCAYMQSTNKIWCDCGIWSGQIRFSFYLFICYSHFICHTVAWNGYEKLKEATTNKINARIYCGNGAFSTKNNFYDVLQSDDGACNGINNDINNGNYSISQNTRDSDFRLLLLYHHFIFIGRDKEGIHSYKWDKTKNDYDNNVNMMKTCVLPQFLSMPLPNNGHVYWVWGGWIQQIIPFQSNFNIYTNNEIHMCMYAIIHFIYK